MSHNRAFVHKALVPGALARIDVEKDILNRDSVVRALMEVVDSHLGKFVLELAQGVLRSSTVETALRKKFDEEIETLVRAEVAKRADELEARVRAVVAERFEETVAREARRLMDEEIEKVRRKLT